MKAILSVLAFVFLFTPGTAATTNQTQLRRPASIESLSAVEFSRLVREFSEEGGYFRSDNFTSNETSYLHVIDKLKELGASGGAYVGVGPEQNFTYIAKVRPRIAFIVDIRRQAIIQHLMFKAIFHLSPTRAQFLSHLLSKPLPKEKVPAPGAPVSELIAVVERTSADDQTYATNLSAIRKLIEEEFQIPLSQSDRATLDYVYKSFRNEGLDIAFRIDGTRGGSFPTLADLIKQTDLNGKLGNFLANRDDYDFVRGLHRKNLIIPVVGDFAGKKALATVGDYLQKKGLIVTAFYTSNVEQYLFESGSFAAFANNVRKLPVNEKSLFIRGVPGRFSHPARVAGHRSTTLLQQIAVFLKDVEEGRYASYSDLTLTHFISADKL